jgi:hypothetical protein
MNFGNVIEMGSSRCKHESDKTNRSFLAALGAEISWRQKTEKGKGKRENGKRKTENIESNSGSSLALLR